MHQRLPCKGESFTKLADELCPCCKEKETQLHFEQCTHNKLPHNDLLIKLSHIAKKNKIDPVLIKLIQRHFLHKAVDEKTLYIDEPTIRWKRYCMVLRTQQVIGWNKLQRGFFSVEWDHLQWRYERTI